MTDTQTHIVKAAILFGRILQVCLVLLAVLLVTGTVLGDMNVIAFGAISIFALVLLAFAGAVEAGIRLGRGWVA